MFARRRNSQKPGDELYAAFKQSFPEVGPGTAPSSSSAGPGAMRSSSLSEALIDPPTSHRYALHCLYYPSLLSAHVFPVNAPHRSTMSPILLEMAKDIITGADYFTRSFENLDDNKDQDTTPKTFHDSWRLTPSLMDPNSYAFTHFANQPPGYYTPTPGGFNTLYHPQAGDLHTPGMGMNTPLSMPHSVHGLHAQDTMHLQSFHPHMLHHAHTFHDPFGQHHQQQTYAPHQFLQHQDSGYVAMDESPHKVTPTQPDMMAPLSGHQQQVQMAVPASLTLPGMPSGEKYVSLSQISPMSTNFDRFRYHTTLNAPTAMIKYADEIPVTYLNKGQAYTVSIFDTAPPAPRQPGAIKYRTYLRVSFEDEQQRARPGACWQLWKEGRGTNEAHQRGGKLLAVEYVDPNQGGDDAIRKSQVELEKASFDGFAVTWYPNMTAGVPDCSISVRFNFLSTDFSHSKGVKGIPVRLCAKTDIITASGSTVNEPEVCFSKVKLFRDHGAERKLSNDVAHVKKTIEKLKQQISQAEAGLGSSGKRKRSGSTVKPPVASKPGKVIKHKRTWSVDSDVEVGRSSAEEDLHMKLVSMQDMFSSTRPVSVLYLRGEPEDDPDLHPVKLPGGEELDPLARTATWESRPTGSDSPTSNPRSSSASSGSQITPKRKHSEILQSGIQEDIDDEYESDSNVPGSGTKSPARPVKVPKLESENTRSDLFALDVDSNYEAPQERPIKPRKYDPTTVIFH
jgi:CP2 transcription factor